MSAATLPPPTRDTIDDLMKHDGKAELINGRIVTEMPGGTRHNYIAGNIYIELRTYMRTHKGSMAYTDSGGFRVPVMESGRESFSPDAAYFAGPVSPHNPGFVDGAPTFAVEVRSPDQYGRAAEAKIAAKRDDYFEAGTLAVWDIDPIAETVTLHTANTSPHVFHRGDLAHAEPAVPGWTMNVDDIFG